MPGNKAIATIFQYLDLEDSPSEEIKPIECDTYRTVILSEPPKISWWQKKLIQMRALVCAAIDYSNEK